MEKNFKNLRYAFQQISNEIKKSRLEKLSQKQLLSYVLDNISDGLRPNEEVTREEVWTMLESFNKFLEK